MKSFFIEKKEKNLSAFGGNNVVYCIFLLLSFCVFSVFSNIFSFIFSENKVDFFVNDLPQIATYFLPVDKEVSEKILILDEIIKEYNADKNILKTKKQELFELWDYITKNKEYLSKLGFTNYESIMQLLSDAYAYREEIFTLLWENQAFNYLILLENTNERRPNGWFFWSFAFVKIEGGHIKELQVVDSYLPDYIAPDTRIIMPQWYQDLYETKKAGFVAGNKFWFTDLDGKNIKTLYELIFNQEYDMERVNQLLDPSKRSMLHNQYIKGIVFLNSSLLTDYLPGFQEKFREWQFTNASVDLIRWENRNNKKELYLKEVVEYFYANLQKILKSLILNRDTILEKRYVQLYFSNVSPDFHSFIREKKLNTYFSDHEMYFWNTIISFNKSDGFIKKTVQVFNADTKEFVTSVQNEILDLSELPAGNYQIQIDYDFNIPEKYFNFIHNLEEKYAITLGEREKNILVTTPFVEENGTYRWKTKEVIYFPMKMTFHSAEGDLTNIRQGKVENASQILLYDTQIEKNNDTKQVRLFFSLS